MIPVAEDPKKCYCIHRQWRFPYLIVLCGNLTIPYCGRFSAAFIKGKQKLKKLRHRPGGHRAAILFNQNLSYPCHIVFIQILSIYTNRFSFHALYLEAAICVQVFCSFILTNYS